MNLALGLEPGSTSPARSFSTPILRLSLFLAPALLHSSLSRSVWKRRDGLASASSLDPPVAKGISTYQALPPSCLAEPTDPDSLASLVPATLSLVYPGCSFYVSITKMSAEAFGPWLFRQTWLRSEKAHRSLYLLLLEESCAPLQTKSVSQELTVYWCVVNVRTLLTTSREG